MFERTPNSYEYYGDESVMVFPDDSAQTIHDAARSSIIMSLLGEDSLAIFTIKSLSLHEV